MYENADSTTCFNWDYQKMKASEGKSSKCTVIGLLKGNDDLYTQYH